MNRERLIQTLWRRSCNEVMAAASAAGPKNIYVPREAGRASYYSNVNAKDRRETTKADSVMNVFTCTSKWETRVMTRECSRRWTCISRVCVYWGFSCSLLWNVRHFFGSSSLHAKTFSRQQTLCQHLSWPHEKSIGFSMQEGKFSIISRNFNSWPPLNIASRRSPLSPSSYLSSLPSSLSLSLLSTFLPWLLSDRSFQKGVCQQFKPHYAVRGLLGGTLQTPNIF